MCSVPFILIGILTPDKFLALLGADAGLVELGKTYLRIVLIFAPFFMCNYSVTAFAFNCLASGFYCDHSCTLIVIICFAFVSSMNLLPFIPFSTIVSYPVPRMPQHLQLP